ncbi:MAG: tetratricopeptide repeat protein [Flavobacteriales bacterium]|nr:tetratricopeptide repeat protein [Flavobacteriales bacterium]
MRKGLTILFLFSSLFVAPLLASQHELDSLLKLANTEKNDSILLAVLNDIGSATYKVDQQLAKKYWTRALKMAEELVKKNPTPYYYEELATANNGMGIISRRMGDYPAALSYYQTCLKITDETGNLADLASTYQNMGIIYRDLEEFDKAIPYYNKGLEIRIEQKDTLGLAGSYNAFGILYRRMKDYDKALECYLKSLELSERIHDDENVAQSYNNIGVIYVTSGDYIKAAEFFKKGYDLHSLKNNEAGMARYHANMSHVYEKQGKIVMAIKEGLKAHDLYTKMDRKNDLSQVAGKLSHLYAKNNNYKNSLNYYKEFIAMRDSVFNEESLREIAQKEMQFEFDKQMMADSLARAEEVRIKEIQYQQKLNQQKTFTYGGALILVIVIIFSAMLYKRLKISNKQKAIIEEQKLIVEIKNKEIVDSINYARRIQSAILPSIERIRKTLPDSFVFYQPKDIVAGDFYWYKERQGKILIAVADCTGHGVPGAMVSVVCHNALNRAVNDFKLIEPAKILDKTAELVREAFELNQEEVKDGMDISLCCFDLENKRLEYAGAINSLFFIRENKLNEVKGDKQPIGQYAEIKPFTNHVLDFNHGDKFYLFSDGYADQFGGVKGKKYMYRRFRDFMLKLSDIDFSKQQAMLKKEFDHWKGNLEQLDDVCIIGVQIS